MGILSVFSAFLTLAPSAQAALRVRAPLSPVPMVSRIALAPEIAAAPSTPAAVPMLGALPAAVQSAPAIPVSLRSAIPAARLTTALQAAADPRAFSKAGMTRAASLAKRRKAAGPRPAPAFFASLYDGGKPSAAPAPVSAAGAAGLRSALLPAGMGSGARGPRSPAGLADPGRPGRPDNGGSGRGVWGFLKAAGLAALGLYGGLQAGDLIYSLALGGGGLPALALTAAAASGAAYMLRRSARAKGPSWLLGPALGTFSLTTLGQLVWDLSASPVIGLSAGAAAALALALYSMGVGARK